MLQYHSNIDMENMNSQNLFEINELKRNLWYAGFFHYLHRSTFTKKLTFMKKILLCIGCIATSIFVNAQSATLDWAKSMEGSSNDVGHAITVDAKRNVYTTGFFNGTVDFDPGAGIFNLTTSGKHIFISKLDSLGNFVWAKNIGGTSNDDTGYSIVTDDSNNVYVTGVFQGTVDFDPGAAEFDLTTIGETGMFILKLNSSGNFVWAKSVSGNSLGYSITLDTFGNIYTTGQFEDTTDFDPGAGTFNLNSIDFYDIFVLKLNSLGDFVWAKSMGGTAHDESSSIKVDALGNVYTTGWFAGTADFDPSSAISNLTSNGDADVFILKLDASGNYAWVKDFGSSAFDRGWAIGIDGLNNIYTKGIFNGTVDFDPNFGTYNLTASGIDNTFISKLDQSGNFIWAKGFSGNSENYGQSIALDDIGNVYTTGQFNGTVDFDPNADSTVLTSIGSADIYVSKLDDSGNLIWAERMGGTQDDAGYAITIDTSGNIYTTGYYTSSADFDPNEGSFILTTTGGNEVFIDKMNQGISTTGIVERNNIDNVIIYPNPTNDVLNIVFSFLEKNVTIQLYNGVGELVYNKAIEGSPNAINIVNLSNGLYFLKMIDCDNNVITKKIIKQ